MATWYARVMGETFGPLGDAELQAMADAKKLSAADEVRRGATGEWVPAATVRGLKFQSDPGGVPSHARQKRSGLGLPIGLAAAVLAVVGCAVFLFLSAGFEQRSAVEAGQAAVLDRLKSPASAKFLDDSVTATKLSGGEWEVGGELDAQNSFGVPLRHHWSAVAKKDSSGTWKASDVTLSK